jgi:hypothetical protein
MSLTEQGYQERKWRGLNTLRFALANEKLADHHYGWSTAHHNKFEALANLLEIGILVSENFERIPVSDGQEIRHSYTEMMRLSQILQDASEQIADLGNRIADEAHQLNRRDAP